MLTILQNITIIKFMESSLKGSFVSNLSAIAIDWEDRERSSSNCSSTVFFLQAIVLFRGVSWKVLAGICQERSVFHIFMILKWEIIILGMGTQ